MRKTIVIVEDDQTLAEMTSVLLAKENYHAIWFSSGADCLDFLRNHPCDLIILDFRLPDMDGLQLIKKIKEDPDFTEVSGVPVIVLTAYLSADEVKKDLMKAGVNAFLHKPFGSSELIDVIDNIFLTNEIRSHREKLTNYFVKLRESSPEVTAFLPIAAFLLDSQLFCKKWNLKAEQQFPFLVQEFPYKPFTQILSAMNQEMAEEIKKHLPVDELESYSLLANLKYAETNYLVKFTIQKLGHEFPEQEFLVLMDIIAREKDLKEKNLWKMLSLDLLPLGIIQIHATDPLPEVKYLNKTAGKLLQCNESDESDIYAMAAERLTVWKREIDYVIDQKKLLFHQQFSHHREDHLNLVFLPDDTDADVVTIILWKQGGVSESTDQKEYHPTGPIPEHFFRQWSHDIRSPLNSLLGFSRLLLRSTDLSFDPVVKEDLQTIYRSGYQVYFLIEELVDFVKVSQKTLQKVPSIININSLLEKIIQDFVSWQNPVPVIHTRFEPIPELESDEELVRKIIHHLLHNSVKFSINRSVPKIWINSYLGEKEVVIEIKDQGMGMPADLISKIPKPFLTGQPVQEKKVKGFGLGLFLVHSFLNVLNGRMKIESSENEGTTVTVFFPLF